MTEALELLPYRVHSSNNQIPAPGLEGLDMDEATLAKLSRAQLQKVAKAHKVRANMKSAEIIKELVKLSKYPPDEESEEPPRKKSRTTGEGLPAIGPVKSAGMAPQNLAGNSSSFLPLPESPNGHPAAEDESSDSGGSYLSYESPSQQGYYKSPVSSRAGTPPAEEPRMLRRAVDIMKQTTADDQRLLSQAAALCQRAARLKEQAKNVRDVVRAERGRRVRLEAYFAHWREIAPNWSKDWIYKPGEEERMRTERVLRAMTPTLPSTGPTGPSTLYFDGRDAPDSHMELRRRQLQPRQEARGQGNGTVPPPADEKVTGSNRLSSPQLATKGRAAKRKHCA